MNPKQPRPSKMADETPSAEPVNGDPVDAWDMVNKYGRCAVQDTTDTDNVFPLIGPLGAGCTGVTIPPSLLKDEKKSPKQPE